MGTEYTISNMSEIAIPTTNLLLYDPYRGNDDSTSAIINLTAPEACIYRAEGQFVFSVSDALSRLLSNKCIVDLPSYSGLMCDDGTAGLINCMQNLYITAGMLLSSPLTATFLVL